VRIISDNQKAGCCLNKRAYRYKNDPQIKAMTDLVDAYQRREVHSAEKILRGPYQLPISSIMIRLDEFV
jgi:hypothetical protein